MNLIFCKYPLSLAVLLLLLAGISSCAPKKVSPVLDQDTLLFEIDKALRAEFESVLIDSAKGLSIDVKLLLALPIDTQQYSNTQNIANPRGYDRALHNFFLLVDNLLPNNMGSVLSNYERIVEAANCISWDINADFGCTLLIRAKANLYTPKEGPGLFRFGWPDWRPVGAIPENWAKDQTLWSYLNINTIRIDAQMNYLYVKLLRPWYSERFINSDGWFMGGTCKGFISDGNPDNDDEENEFLPRIPLGFVMAKNIVVSGKNEVVWNRKAPHIIAWVYKPVTLSPKNPDPCRKDCPSHEKFKPYCGATQ